MHSPLQIQIFILFLLFSSLFLTPVLITHAQSPSSSETGSAFSCPQCPSSPYQSFTCPSGQPLSLSQCEFDFSIGQCNQHILGCAINTTLLEGVVVTQYTDPCLNQCGESPSNSSVKQCPDGSASGYSTNCELLKSGLCGYRFISCPSSTTSQPLESSTGHTVSITCQTSECGSIPEGFSTQYECFDGSTGGLIGCSYDQSIHGCGWMVNPCLPASNSTSGGSASGPNITPNAFAAPHSAAVGREFSRLLLGALIVVVLGGAVIGNS